MWQVLSERWIRDVDKLKNKFSFICVSYVALRMKHLLHTQNLHISYFAICKPVIGEIWSFIAHNDHPIDVVVKNCIQEIVFVFDSL